MADALEDFRADSSPMVDDLLARIELQERSPQTPAIPRHREVNDFLARKICRDLGIPEA